MCIYQIWWYIYIYTDAYIDIITCVLFRALMYTYVCMLVSTFTCTHVYMHLTLMCIHIHRCTYSQICTSKDESFSKHLRTHVYTCLFKHLRARMIPCISILHIYLLYMKICIHMYLHMYIYTCTYICSYPCIYPSKKIDVRTRTHTFQNIHVHTCLNIHFILMHEFHPFFFGRTPVGFPAHSTRDFSEMGQLGALAVGPQSEYLYDFFFGVKWFCPTSWVHMYKPALTPTYTHAYTHAHTHTHTHTHTHYTGDVMTEGGLNAHTHTFRTPAPTYTFTHSLSHTHHAGDVVREGVLNAQTHTPPAPQSHMPTHTHTHHTGDLVTEGCWMLMHTSLLRPLTHTHPHTHTTHEMWWLRGCWTRNTHPSRTRRHIHTPLHTPHTRCDDRGGAENAHAHPLLHEHIISL